MIKSNRLSEIAMVVGDSVSESAYVNWNSSEIWPVDLLTGQCAFVIWKQTSNQKQPFSMTIKKSIKLIG